MGTKFSLSMPPSSGVTVEDLELARRLEACELADFSHHDHVRVAWVYLRVLALHEGAGRFIESIKRFAIYKGANGLYHETITWAFLLMIRDRIGRLPGIHGWGDFKAAHPDLLESSTRFLHRYYRSDTLKSDLARHTFVFPDRYEWGKSGVASQHVGATGATS